MRAPWVVLFMLAAGCGDDQPATPDASPDSIDDFIGEHPALAIACNDSATDIFVLPTLPTMDDSHRGDVFRCSKSEKLTTNEVKARIEEDNVLHAAVAVPGTINSGFWSYRIAFRSTRNTFNAARVEGDMAATVLIPANPIPGAPLVVWGHGSTGIASKCAPSRYNLAGPSTDQDYPPMLYRLAGYGFTVVAPDYTGYSYGQAPGYFNAEDAAHAILDSTRAAAKLLTTPPAKVVFVGHSQGGHAVIAAHAYAKTYGMTGELVGVATLAPFWNSMSIWAAATSPAAGLTTATDTNSILYAMSYAYSAGELRGGTGMEVFQTAKQTAARDVILNECYDSAGLQALGATPSDFFEANYVNDVGSQCAVSLTPNCTSQLAMKWVARWAEERPKIDAMGAPILAIFGGKDTTVPLGRAGCAKKKLLDDLASVNGATTQVTLCWDRNAAHRDIIRGPNVDYLNQWVAAKGGAGTAPVACTEFPPAQICSTPPNDY
jgi:pimeloyl-ACP methyl ester carboxylesterase